MTITEVCLAIAREAGMPSFKKSDWDIRARVISGYIAQWSSLTWQQREEAVNLNTKKSNG